MDGYIVKSPVLLLIFNRPDTTRQVFDQIRRARPTRLYIAADGPRTTKEGEAVLCEEARTIALEVDWQCTVKTLYRDQNLGCKKAVHTAINWFFEQEEEGIILEDDCLPVSDFFYFCDSMLEHYRQDTRVMNVTGTNLQFGKKWGNASYYFSRYSHIWGWASWRRAWKAYDVNLEKYNEEEAHRYLSYLFDDMFLLKGWMDIFRRLKAGEIDSWDYQFNLITFFENALCVTPNVNLISNLGFRPDATHTYNVHMFHASLPAGKLEKPIIHPDYFIPETEADYFFLKKDFYLEPMWKRHNKKTKRFKRWLRGLLR